MTHTVSPFSNQHKWELKWRRIPSRELSKQRSGIVFETNSRKEKKALEAIASVGLIEGNQLQKIFKLKKPQIRRIESFNLIMRHFIRKNGQDVPFIRSERLVQRKLFLGLFQTIGWSIELKMFSIGLCSFGYLIY